TANAIANDGLDVEVDFLVPEGPKGAGAEAAAGDGIVVRASNAGSGGAVDRASESGRRSSAGGADNRARINAVAEGADDAEDFVVAEAGIEGSLDDEVRSFVRRVAGCVEGVVKTAVGTGSELVEVLEGGDRSGRGSVG